MANKLPRVKCINCRKEKIITQCYQFSYVAEFKKSYSTLPDLNGAIELNFCTKSCLSTYFSKYLKRYQKGTKLQREPNYEYTFTSPV